VTTLDPFVLAMLAGVLLGIVVLITTLLRMGGPRTDPLAYISKARPDRRAKRLDAAVASSPILQRAVEVTANLASRRGLLGSVERSLRAADVPVRPAEVILAWICASAVMPALTLVTTQSMTKVGIVLVMLVAGPPLALRRSVARRRKKFSAQLPDAVTTLAGSLRAGRSLGQAMEALSRELQDPMGRELRKVVAEVRLGRTLHEALSDAVERIASDDFRWTVLAMQIQAEVGGNLAELLDQVAATMRERSRMKGEVKALTAEGRASALMLVVMVPALGGVMYMLNNAYMAPLFSTRTGHIMLGVSAVMIGGGYLWMSRMVKIDV
jgi:tight adherence protein B